MKLIIENNKMYLKQNNNYVEVIGITLAPVKKAKHVEGATFSQQKAFKFQYFFAGGSVKTEYFTLKDAHTSILEKIYTNEEWDLLKKYFLYNEIDNILGQVIEGQFAVKVAPIWKNDGSTFATFDDALLHIVALQRDEDEIIKSKTKNTSIKHKA